jgi:hypothetical protein
MPFMPAPEAPLSERFRTAYDALAALDGMFDSTVGPEWHVIGAAKDVLHRRHLAERSREWERNPPAIRLVAQENTR